MIGRLRDLPSSSSYRHSPDFKPDFESNTLRITTSFCFDYNILSISSCNPYNDREILLFAGFFLQASFTHSMNQ